MLKARIELYRFGLFGAQIGDLALLEGVCLKQVEQLPRCSFGRLQLALLFELDEPAHLREVHFRGSADLPLHICINHTRCDGVNLHRVRLVHLLDAHAARQHIEPGFGGAVGTPAGVGLLPRARGDAHDPLHDRPRLREPNEAVRQQRGRDEIDLQAALQVVRICSADRRHRLEQASIVDERDGIRSIHRAEDSLHERIQALRVRQVVSVEGKYTFRAQRLLAQSFTVAAGNAVNRSSLLQ